jgi:hypothetical protein
MRPQEKEELVRIIAEIEGFIVENGGIFSDWYVGITANIKWRLHGYHNVKDTSVFVKSPSIEFAHIIQRYFIEVRKTDGDITGKDDGSFCVYAYKKRKHTKENDEKG